jgi:hypothetical protein
MLWYGYKREKITQNVVKYLLEYLKWILLHSSTVESYYEVTIISRALQFLFLAAEVIDFIIK